MKKLIFFILLIFQISLIFAQTPTFKQIDEKEIKLGNKYFYVFEGAKWQWSLDLLGTKSNFSWKVHGTYKITDGKNNLKDKIGLMTKCKETNSIWYFIEQDDFLCMYEQADKGYTITKFLPLQPKIGMKWTANARQSIVTSVTDDFVKIEVEDEKKATTGYRLFRKNVGLYDLFEIEKNRRGQITTKWTLTDYVPPKIDTPTTTVNPVSTTTVVQTTTTTLQKITTSTTNTTIRSNAEYITTLPQNVILIQVGSYSTEVNAENCFTKYCNLGYECLIYIENNMYKILIKTTDTNLINTLKSGVAPGAFVKQR